MSEIYSDKLPECCADCPCLDELWFCELINEWVDKTSDGKKFDYYHDRHPSCPIKSLSVLTSKLAESESRVKVGEFWHSAYQGKQLDYDKVYAELRQSYDENEKLKQQLAKKEKLLRKYAATSCPIHQDKISFAVEQLEKVKNEIYGSEVKFEEIEKLPIALNNYEIGYDKGRFKATNIIDNQIKQLKEKN